jgi:TonB-linked SusC/RagA family outer membrane protein
MKKSLLFLLVLLGASLDIFAQGKTVSGKVTAAEDNSPLPGVNVIVKGTMLGTATDADGNFALSVPEGSTLVFTFIGLQTQEIAVGSNTVVDVKMNHDAKQLTEVVVTALGIERDQKTLTYATQQVGGDKLRVTRDTDLNNTLAGKFAGVQVAGQAGSKLGSTAAIRIRGAASLSDRGPLYVLDGTAIDPSLINMDNVESISILKGPNATALYGQRGDGGVVMITSKKGKKSNGIGVSIGSTTTFEKVNILPKYQNVYGGGGSSDFLTFEYKPGVHPADWAVFNGKQYPDYADDASWGPKMDGSEYIPWYAWYPGSKYSFKTAKFTPQKNNVRDFYETGVTLNNNVALSKAGDGYNVNLSYTDLHRTGIIPNSSLTRRYLSVNSSVDLGKHFVVGLNLNYSHEDLKGSFNDGYGNYGGAGSFQQWFHRDLDMSILRELRDFRTPTGALASWNHTNPTATTDYSDAGFNKGNYWYNFYSYLDKVSNDNVKDQLFGDLNLTYKINDHLKVQGFARRDQLHTHYEYKVPTILELSGRQTSTKAGYATGLTETLEENYEGVVTYQNQFKDWDISANIGGNIRRNTYNEALMSTTTGLVVPDLFTISNSKGTPSYSNFRSLKIVRSVYARTSFGYKDLLYVDLTARNDWSSALPANNNSYFYPSVGTSFIFSELLTGQSILSLGKLRANWAQIGSDLDPYRLVQTYGVNTAQYSGNILTGVSDVLTNPAIIPAKSTSYEGGFDLKFFDNRVGLSATYYKEIRKNEIITVSVSSTSGYASNVINAGQVERSGIELQLNVVPIRTDNFTWDVTFNAARNRSRVIKLTDGVNAIEAESSGFNNADDFGYIRVYNKTNADGGSNAWGQLRGNGIRYKDGQPVLNEDGTYAYDENVYFGSALPDFTGGIFNSLTYKNFQLNISIDFQKGGKYFSLSNFWGEYSGLYSETAATNDKGMNVRDDVANGGGVHVKGVDENGNPVDKYVSAYDYYHQFGNNSIVNNSLFDASYVKLREISLGYNIPLKNKSIVQSLSVSLVARNPWLIYLANRNFDVSELSQRFTESGQQPGTRSIGLGLKASF